MNINIFGFGILSLVILYFLYQYRVFNATGYIPTRSGLLVPEQVGKTRSIQSKSGDASMHTEYSRRKAIIYGMSGQHDRIRESRASTGSTTGALEAFFLTAIASPPIVPLIQPPSQICYDIFEGGGVTDEFCYVLDDKSEGIEYDAGGVNTIVCGI
jgi:hypothetical protein